MERIEVSPQPNIEFSRFLYICQEIPKYWAGKCKTNMKFPSQTLFSKMVESAVDTNNILNILEEANENSALRIPIIYATAALVVVLSKEKDFLHARDRIYGLIPTILKNSDELFLFTKYTTDMGLKKGSRWQKCMNSWYNKHGSNVLFKDLITIRSKYGWTHKDICNLLHMRNSSEVQLCLAYIYGGMEAVLSNKTMMEKYQNSGIQDIIVIDQLRKSQNITDATLLVKNNAYIKSTHVPERFFCNTKASIEMWTILINRMDITELLHCIPKLQQGEKLNVVNKKKPKETPQLILDIVKILSANTTSPFKAFIAYSNYNKFAGVTKKKKIFWDKELEKLAKEAEEQDESPNKKNVKGSKKQKKKVIPQPLLLESLLSLTERSLNATEMVLEGRCLITLDMRELMFISPKSRNKRAALQALIPDFKVENEGVEEVKPALDVKDNDVVKPAKCFYSKNVVPGNAGILIALYFMKYMKNTTVAIFTHEGIEVIDLYETKEDGTFEFPTMKQAEDKLRNPRTGRAALHQPFLWAIANEKEFDLFLNIVDTPTRIKKYPKPLRTVAKDVKSALLNYQETMKMPTAKTVTLTLSTQNALTTNDSIKGILDISGFDEYLPNIIKNFYLGNFQ